MNNPFDVQTPVTIKPSVGPLTPLTVNTTQQGSTPSLPTGETNPFDIIPSILRSGPRAGAALEQTGEELATGKPSTYQPTSPAEKFLFGTTPIQGLSQQTASGTDFLKSKGVPSALAFPAAFAGTLGMEALDLTPFGGGESGVVKALAATKDVAETSKILLKIGVHPDLIPSFAEAFAKTTDENVVKQGLQALDKIQKTTRPPLTGASVTQKGATPAIETPKTAIPPELQPLAQEAQKYKSAEEFVNEVLQPSLATDAGKKYGDYGWRLETRKVSELSPSDFIEPKEWKQEYGADLLKAARQDKLPPPTIETDGTIIDGNHRLEAAIRAGKKEIPVLVHDKNAKAGTISNLTDFYNKVRGTTEGRSEGQPPAEGSSLVSAETSAIPKTPETPTSVGSLQELNQSRKMLEPSPNPTADFKYVKNEPLNVTSKATDKLTARDIRTEYSSVKNSQVVRGNQLASEIRKMAPKEQEGMFWYKATKGDTATLEGLLKDEKFAPYKAGIESALKLSPEAKAALAKGEQYYSEAGQVAKNTGTIENLRENYQNRIYKPEPEQDFVKTEAAQRLKQTTSHAKGRVFDTEMQAVEAGKQFATTNYADALAIHNEEMARVNTARKLMNTMEQGGLGAWTERVPSNWQQVGQLRKGGEVFAAPKGIAQGLRAIADPDFMHHIDTIKFLQKYQGLVKSVDLAFSFFHHLTFITQTLSSKKGLTTLAQMVGDGLKMETPGFKAMELDFVRNGGMTTHVSATQDIMRELALGNDNVSKLLRLPIGKQINAAIQASNRFLFEKMQRFMKTMTYQKNIANWIAKHPNATNEEVIAAKRGYAKATNAEFGGLNWQAMGITKSEQSILRTIFLAPDWLTSAGAQTKYAFSDAGTAGQQARYTLVKAIIGGMVITEGLNKLITGHFTDQNPKGHTMEIEVAPNVYISLVRGAPGELVKLISNVAENGAQGAARYLEGKLSPLGRTGLGVFSGVNYAGQNIYQGGKHPTALSKTFGGLMFVLQNASPIPFGLTATAQELGSGQANPLGVGATALGLGRYSAAPKKKSALTSNPFNI